VQGDENGVEVAGDVAAVAERALPVDTALVQALLTGRDPVLHAMDSIRQALAPATIFFEREGQPEGASCSAKPGAIVAEVRHGQRVYGNLISHGCAGGSPDALRSWADWLATWLALKDQHDQLRNAAFVDDLTGAWNRRYFDRFLDAAMKHAGEHAHSVTVMYFDIDDFKKYNDQYGHAAGDDILRETVRLLKSVIRPTDRVCRIGGDEFGVIFHEPEGPRDPESRPPNSVWSIAERFQRQIREHRFPKLGELAAGTLTISGGLASFPVDGQTPEELVRRADELAIQSKRLGKNAIKMGPGAERVCRAD